MKQGIDQRYFAYGSNLRRARMRSRVPSVQALGPARLGGVRFALDKCGADGSAKANLVSDAGGIVWGVLYRLDPSHWQALDALEPGYTRIAVTVALGGRGFAAWTYRSRLRAPKPIAHNWYKQLILDGAREHRLPEAYLAMLAALPAR